MHLDSDTIYIFTGYEDDKKIIVSRDTCSNYFTRLRQNNMFICSDFIKKIFTEVQYIYFSLSICSVKCSFAG